MTGWVLCNKMLYLHSSTCDLSNKTHFVWSLYSKARQECKFKINTKIALVRYFSETLITFPAELYVQTFKYCQNHCYYLNNCVISVLEYFVYFPKTCLCQYKHLCSIHSPLTHITSPVTWHLHKIKCVTFHKSDASNNLIHRK